MATHCHRFLTPFPAQKSVQLGITADVWQKERVEERGDPEPGSRVISCSTCHGFLGCHHVQRTATQSAHFSAHTHTHQCATAKQSYIKCNSRPFLWILRVHWRSDQGHFLLVSAPSRVERSKKAEISFVAGKRILRQQLSCCLIVCDMEFALFSIERLLLNLKIHFLLRSL